MGKTYPVAKSLSELGDVVVNKTSRANVVSTDEPINNDTTQKESPRSDEDLCKVTETPTDIGGKEPEKPNERPQDANAEENDPKSPHASNASSRGPEPPGEGALSRNMTTILARDIPSHIDREFLHLYCENKRYGGGPCKVVYFSEQMRDAAIEFVDPKGN